MKSISIFLLCFVSLAFAAVAAPGPDCKIRPSCLAGESPVLYVSNYTNAHGELVSAAPHNYSLQICCLDPIDQTCNGSNTMFRLSNTTNAHMQLNMPWITGGREYDYDVCIDGGISIVYGETNPCPEDYQCVASVPHYDNNHIFNCTDPAYKKICIDNNPPICELFWANITAVGCPLGNCTVGDNITIQAESATTPGCAPPGQIKEIRVLGFANASGLNCSIDMSPSADITGMNISVSPPPFTYIGNWTITSVPPNCKGQTIQPILGELWSASELMATTTNVSGSFTINGTVIEMKCGNVSIDGDATFSKTCELTDPPQNGSCSLAQCVYGNETTGTFIGCYNIGNVRDNKDGEPIICSNSGTWCPEFFEYNLTSGYCEPNLWTCDRGKKVFGPPWLTCDDSDAAQLFQHAGMCLSDFVPPGIEFPFVSACCQKTRWDGYFFYGAEPVVIY